MCNSYGKVKQHFFYIVWHQAQACSQMIHYSYLNCVKVEVKHSVVDPNKFFPDSDPQNFFSD
jgi:hypothetical protein